MKSNQINNRLFKTSIKIIVIIVTLILLSKTVFASTVYNDRTGFTGGPGIGIGGFAASTGEGFPSVYFKGELGYGLNVNEL